jgi:GNAT superfamily N-acetyltransferase
MADHTVRGVERGDREQWSRLWRGYLDFYSANVTPEATEATWRRLFDPLEPVHGLVAVRGETLVGLSHYLFQRSTWLVEARCYLQDLFVNSSERGTGVGGALIAAVAAAAKEAGAPEVFWNTHETNATARRLYDAVALRTGFIQYRIAQ